MIQKVEWGIQHTENLEKIISELGVKKIFLIHGNSFYNLPFKEKFDACGTELIHFQAFSSNPKYEEVVEGVRVFEESNCDSIIAVGGGSAIDVAKCIKAFYGLSKDKLYFEQILCINHIPLIAIPTTAGTGSEATQFAVIYYQGEKRSVAHESLIPEYVILAPESLGSLPEYQKKATAMDALSHAVESYWSIYSTKESKEYSLKSLDLLFRYLKEYLKGNKEAYPFMMRAAFLAGKAINIAKTTAGHAMSYKLTSLFSLPHGHAAVLCMVQVWEYMLMHMVQCSDKRGKEYLQKTFTELADAFQAETPFKAVEKTKSLLQEMELFPPALTDDCTLEKLVHSVNTERLQNTPVKFSEKDLYNMYCGIFQCKNEAKGMETE